MAPFTKRVELHGIGWAEASLLPSQLVELGDRLVPPRIDVHFHGADWPEVDMVLEVVDGLPQCREFRVRSVEGGREIRPLDLKAATAQLNEWVEQFFAKFALAYERADDGSMTMLLQDSPESHSAGVKAFQKASKGKGARTLNGDFLLRVAKIYTDNPSRPTRAVRDAFGVSDSMANKYVRKAREAGVLAPRG